MNEAKTNIGLLEAPVNNRLPSEGVTDVEIFADLIEQEEKYLHNPTGFMDEVQDLINGGKFGTAYAMLDTAESLTSRDDPKKISDIMRKKSEVSKKWANAEDTDDLTIKGRLDDAKTWKNLSDQYSETARKKEEEAFSDNPRDFLSETKELLDSGRFSEAYDKYKIAEKMKENIKNEDIASMTYMMAEGLQRVADSGTFDPNTSLAILDDAEKLLITSDENYAIKYEKEKRERKEKRKRALKFGAKIVINTFRSTIKSTLNRHS
jgi:hypothetical protein